MADVALDPKGVGTVFEFLMPSLGRDMAAGTLVRWLVRPGDRVARGQAVAVVETSKGAIDIEALSEGVIEELLVAEGTTVPVGEPIALLNARLEATTGPA